MFGSFGMARGAIQALQEAGREIPFIGGSAVNNGFLRLAKELNLDFYAVQFPPGASLKCVDTVVDVLEGKPVKKFVSAWDVLDNVEPFGPEGLDKFFKPQFSDDYEPPDFYPDEVYREAGF